PARRPRRVRRSGAVDRRALRWPRRRLLARRDRVPRGDRGLPRRRRRPRRPGDAHRARGPDRAHARDRSGGASERRRGARAGELFGDLREEEEPTDPDRGDFVRASGPRFPRPRWTPAPDVVITSERASTVSGEITKKSN